MPPPGPGGRPVPAQLPVDVPSFVGRADHLARLDAVLAGPASTGVVITVLSGTAGVGKPNPGLWHTTSDPLNEELTFGFKGATKIDEIRVYTGNGFDENTWQQFARANFEMALKRHRRHA